MSDETQDEGNQDDRLDLLEEIARAQEHLIPLIDAADGIKAQIMARDWDDENAEGIAYEWLVCMIHMVFDVRVK